MSGHWETLKQRIGIDTDWARVDSPEEGILFVHVVSDRIVARLRFRQTAV